jgi:Spy/CpxP family protein refolding chaperone
MKTSFFAVTVLWVGAAFAQAPDVPPPGGGPGMRHENPAQRMDHLATLLDLSDAQKAQVSTILQEEHAKARAAHQQAQAAREQIQQETLAKLTPVLSAAQLKKFQVLMAERGPPGGPPPQ